MSTKNLARTVIEGGRAPSNRWERRYSNAQERTRERAVSNWLLTSVELDNVVYPPRAVVYRGFRDKLAPAERWLGSQVGRPWNKVQSDLCARFDTRTTAGRHILFDHLLRSVDVGGQPQFGRVDFIVDRYGVLQRNSPRRRRHFTSAEPLPEQAHLLEAWLGGRRVGERGLRVYWFVPTESGFFRQHHAMSDAEATRWGALPVWFQRKFAAFSPSAAPVAR